MVYLLFILNLPACTNGQVQLGSLQAASVATRLQSGASAALYYAPNGMPVSKPFTGVVATPIPIWVQVVDQYGNPTVPPTTLNINFAVLAGSGSLSPVAVPTDAQGRAMTTYTPSTTRESAIVGAAGFGQYALQVPIVVTPSTPAKFVFSPLQNYVSTGDSIRGIAYATDAYGNETSTYVGSPSLTWSAASQTLNFTALSYGRTAFQLAETTMGNYPLVLTDPGFASTYSSITATGYSSGSIAGFDTAGVWSTAANWSTGVVPSISNQVELYAATCSLTGLGSAQRLSFASTTTFTNAGTLNIYGTDISLGAGTFDGSTGTIGFQGSGTVQEIFPSTNSAALGTITGGSTYGVTFGPGVGLMTVNSLNLNTGTPLTINGNVMVTGAITVPTGATLQINAGATLVALGGLSVNSSGSKLVVAGGTLIIGSGTTLSASGGGSIFLLGAPGTIASVDVYGGTGSYSISASGSGTFKSDFVNIKHLATSGLTIGAGLGSFVLDNTSFLNLLAGTTVINSATSPQSSTFAKLIFDDTGAPGNVSPIDATLLPTPVYFLNATLNSNSSCRLQSIDPNGFVIWDQ